MASDDQAAEDSDPVVASYEIYIKPHLKDAKKVYILQFPNRNAKQSYSVANSSLPLELRLKEKSGLVEVDVPVDTFRNYDREKGVKWGEAVRKSDNLRGGDGGSHGLAGGFGIGGGHSARPRGAMYDAEDEAVSQEVLVENFSMSVANGRVLTKQTLGGQAIPIDRTTPQYMIGAFRDDQLHLTPVNHIVQMRPQFHHIDAQSELDRGRARDQPAGGRAAEPRPIHMTVKPTADGEEETTDTMAERVRAVQEEPWRQMRYVDEDSAEAWQAFNEHLFVEDPVIVPRLESVVGTGGYLDAISAPRSPGKVAKMSKLRKKG